ncbi:sialic acid-binding Ig-like lectin 13 [Symphorus nematophorus]
MLLSVFLVSDSPPRPRIEISGDLQEKESVTITCSASTPCPHSPPKLTWNLQQDSHNKIEENTDGTFTTKIQETITLSEQHDGYNITCSARYPVNGGQDVKTAEETKTLSVSYSPRDTLVISPSDPVSVGSMVNLTCSCRGNPPPVHFVWFMVSDGRLELIKVKTRVYAFNVTNSDRGVLADCPKKAVLSIATPKRMEALSGSCLQIPCNFSPKSEQDFDSRRDTFGVWIKNDPRFVQNPNNVIFNRSETANSYPMRIIGKLREKNCSTLFSSLNTSYTDTYYFRIENNPFMATASCDPLRIIVKDSPPSPRIEISGDLQEKESVTITCSAFTPCPHSPPKLTWNLQQDSHNKTEGNTDGTFTTKIQETITLSDQHDGYNITCSARYPVNGGQDVKTAEETKTLSVSYAPKDTSVSISPLGLVSAGSWVNLTCSSRAKPPVSSFTWFKDSTDGPMSVSEGQIYRVNVTDGRVYYCVATNDLGNKTSSEIHLNIKGAQQPGSPWGAVVGGLIGITVLICVVAAIWWVKSKHPTLQQIQDLSDVTEKEEIHYGEIDFSKRRPEPSSASVKDSGQQLDTLYAQVKVSKKANSLTQTTDSPEHIYAQVKKE